MKKYIKRIDFFKPLSIIIIIFILSSCEDDTGVTPVLDEVADSIKAVEQIPYVKQWIHNVMDDVYYWTDELPAFNVSDTQSPEDYFQSILSDKDRFSYITDDYGALSNSLSGVATESGYEFQLIRTSDDGDVGAVISYIKADSPASNTDLTRGDMVIEVNGTVMTIDNYRTLIDEMGAAHKVTFARYNETNDKFELVGEEDLSTVEYSENPIFLSKVIEQDGIKIGYLVYNFFSDGKEGSDFDAKLDEEFASFKSEGITELVLDFRYNGGGSVNSALHLGSLLGSGISTNDIFYQYTFNDRYQEYYENQEDNDFLKTTFLEKTNNIGSSINKLYIIVSSRTASASELIINGLNPFMEVVLIGGKTVGKNVGSIAIEDTENEANNYGLLPIVFALANKDGFSDYGDGFAPATENEMKELNYLPLQALGSLDEPLLGRALQLIAGDLPARQRPQRNIESLEVIASSLDFKPRHNRLILER